MKNKKKQFEALKNKIKSLFFKKTLNFEKNPNVFKLLFEKENKINNISSFLNTTEPKTIIKEQKNFTNEFIKNNSNIINQIKQVKNITNIIDNQVDKKEFSQLTNVINFERNNTVQKFTNEFIKNNITSNTQNFKNNYNLRELYLDQTKLLNTTNNTENIKIKFIEKPEDFKNIDKNQILNTTSFDFKTIYVPSKSEILKIKNSVVNKATNNILSPIQQNVSNIFTTANNYIKNNIIDRNLPVEKTAYVMPAYYDGTGGPIKQDTIAKIHKNEIILNANEAKNLNGAKSGIVKNDSTLNLQPSAKNVPEQVSFKNDVIQKEKNILRAEGLEQVEKNDLVIPDTLNKARTSALNNPKSMSKKDNSIKNNLGPPIYLQTEGRKKTPPSWRVSMG